MLCFNKSWRNHNRDTQTLMSNSVLEFGDAHQASLRSSLSFSAWKKVFISDMQFSPSYTRTQPRQAGDLRNL